MSTPLQPPLLDPEVEALLAEIARDPRSSLLRAPRARNLPELFRPPDLVRPSATFLTRAERHLLAVHREEVAFLLETGVSIGLASYFRSVIHPIAIATQDSLGWRRRVQGLSCGDPAQPMLAREGAYLQPLIAPLPRLGHILDAALAAGRLRDSAFTTVKQALCLAELGNARTAELRIAITCKGVTGAPNEGILWADLGFAGWRTGNFSEAASAYGQAWRTGLRDPHILACWALNTALARDPIGEVEASAQELDLNTDRLLAEVRKNVDHFHPQELGSAAKIAMQTGKGPRANSKTSFVREVLHAVLQ